MSPTPPQRQLRSALGNLAAARATIEEDGRLESTHEVLARLEDQTRLLADHVEANWPER